jgi:two-component system, LytTR family, response regulator LytT
MSEKKILIVEDEVDLGQNIREFVENFGYGVAAILDEGKKVIRFLETTKVDLILMDIQIKGEMDGIDLCFKVKDQYNIPIIFITAYSDRSYLERISTVLYDGYLLKPFKAESLKSAIFLALQPKPIIPANKQMERLSLRIRDKGYVVPIPISEILYLRAEGLYTKVITSAKTYIIRDILKDLQAQLPTEMFVRCHKSYLVNISQVISYNSKELNIKGAVIPVRRGFSKEFEEIKP